MATIATYSVPKVENENNVRLNWAISGRLHRLTSQFAQKHYAKGSPDRKALEAALHEARQKTLEVPTVIDGKEVRTSSLGQEIWMKRPASALCDRQ